MSSSHSLGSPNKWKLLGAKSELKKKLFYFAVFLFNSQMAIFIVNSDCLKRQLSNVLCVNRRLLQQLGRWDEDGGCSIRISAVAGFVPCSLRTTLQATGLNCWLLHPNSDQHLPTSVPSTELDFWHLLFNTFYEICNNPFLSTEA